MPKEPSIKPAAIVVAAYVLGIVVLAYSMGGVFNPNNGRVMVGFILLKGGLVLWILAGVAAFYSFRCLGSGDEGFGAYTGSAVLLFGAPMVASVLASSVYQHLDRRDFAAIGVTELRKEAATLMESARVDRGPARHIMDLPPLIQRIAKPRRGATVMKQGVFITTSGLASVRSGYFITPPGSRYEPKGSRTIADGVYYASNPWEDEYTSE